MKDKLTEIESDRENMESLYNNARHTLAYKFANEHIPFLYEEIKRLNEKLWVKERVEKATNIHNPEHKETIKKAFNYIESDERNTLIMESHIYNLLNFVDELQKNLVEENENYRDTIRRTIDHIKHPDSKEESTEELHNGLISWLDGVLDGKW